MRETLGRILREPGFYGAVVALAGVVGVGWADDLAGYPEGRVADLQDDVAELRDDGRMAAAERRQDVIDTYDDEARVAYSVRVYGIVATVLGGVALGAPRDRVS